MKTVVLSALTALCIFLFSACAPAPDDGILIVPGTQAAAADGMTAVTESDAVLETEPTAVTAAEPASDALLPPDTAEASDAVRQLLAEPSFLALLEQNGVDVLADAKTVAGVASAVLAYLDGRQENDETSPTGEAAGDAETVWWTQGGSVWHVSADCPALAKSKSVSQGSQTEAAAAGKSRACKRCGS